MNSYISYILQRKKWQFVIIVVLVAVMISFAFLLPAYLGSLWSAADPLIGFITPMIATFIWLNDTKREWINSLPKKLTVHFKYQGKYVMSCINAPLVGEHDMRAYGQSIGGQISGMRNDLPLDTFFDAIMPNKPVKTRTKELSNIYTVTFYLTRIEDFKKNLKGSEQEKNEKTAKMEALIASYSVWFDNNATNDKCEKLKPINPCPSEPYTEDQAYEIHIAQKMQS